MSACAYDGVVQLMVECSCPTGRYDVQCWHLDQVAAPAHIPFERSPQPSGSYVSDAEAEFEGEETTWPEVQERAWELQRADEAEDCRSEG